MYKRSLVTDVYLSTCCAVLCCVVTCYLCHPPNLISFFFSGDGSGSGDSSGDGSGSGSASGRAYHIILYHT